MIERPLGRAFAPHRVDEAASGASFLARAGYVGLLALALALPFELTQRPLIQTRLLTLTNLKFIEYVVAVLGLLSLALPVGLLIGGMSRRLRHALGPLAGRELALALFGALLL